MFSLLWLHILFIPGAYAISTTDLSFSDIIDLLQQSDHDHQLDVLPITIRLHGLFNADPSLKWMVATNPKLTTDIFIPLIHKYHHSIHQIYGFPDFSFSEIGANRSLAIYQALASCGSDPFFSLRVYALKMIDLAHPMSERVAECMSMEDIVSLHSTMIGVNIGLSRDIAIMDTVYSPRYYSDSECFIKFVDRLHCQFWYEAQYSRLLTAQRMIKKNKLGVRWHVAVQLWLNDAVQERVRKVIGGILDELNEAVIGLVRNKKFQRHFDAVGWK